MPETTKAEETPPLAPLWCDVCQTRLEPLTEGSRRLYCVKCRVVVVPWKEVGNG